VARLDAQRAAYVARSSDDAWTLVRQHATVIAQAEASYRDASLRDPGMADNVRWLLDHPAKGSKMILWAHNAHVAFSPIGFDALGRLLKKAHGSAYFSLGFAFDHGSFQSLDATDPARPPRMPPQVFSVGPAPAGSLDEALGLAKMPVFAVDLRAAPPACAGWLASRLVTRSVGGVYFSEPRTRVRRAPARSFDALLYVGEVTAAHPNPKLR
jgi:erythromycin esterase